MKNAGKFRYLTDAGLKRLVKGLLKEYAVYGTVKKDGFPAFARITDEKALDLGQTPTHISAKEFLFPQRETLLRFNIADKSHEAVIEYERQAIIGLHPCDIHAINLMDRVFAYGTPDENYLARRRNTVIIGADCFPDEYCFCASLGTDDVDSGFDIFLHRIKKGYLVRTGTEAGEEILNELASARVAAPKELKELDRIRTERLKGFKAKIDAPPGELPAVYARSDESPVWEKIGAICYGCGSCNNVCPTCYCFDVRDEVRPNLTEGERVRTWDGCMLEDFAKVAGGHSFRKTRAERLRHRFNRKFRYLSDTFNALFCVGCGRCSRTCLVKINISEVTNELIREDRKR